MSFKKFCSKWQYCKAIRCASVLGTFMCAIVSWGWCERETQAHHIGDNIVSQEFVKDFDGCGACLGLIFWIDDGSLTKAF